MMQWVRAFGRGGAASEWGIAPLGSGRRFAGTPGDDVIRGDKGDNYLDLSQGGDDVVDGRSGDDTIYFGAALTAADRVDGFKGMDELVLSGDYSSGMELNGEFIKNIEKVILVGGNSYQIGGDFDFNIKNNIFYLDASDLDNVDVLDFFGDMTNKYTRVIAGDGDDILRGGDYGCLLNGGDGDDTLSVGARNGVLEGGRGLDQLISGVGTTAFIYTTQDDSTRKMSDLIQGFKEDDQINLTAVDADPTQPGDQAFHFGSTPGHVGDLTVHYNKTQDLTIVRAYTDGDAKADIEIHLQGHVPLTPADFAL